MSIRKGIIKVAAVDDEAPATSSPQLEGNEENEEINDKKIGAKGLPLITRILAIAFITLAAFELPRNSSWLKEKNISIQSLRASIRRNPKPDSTIEIITSEERIKTLNSSLEGKENIALGKGAAQSSTGKGVDDVATSNVKCNCPLTCTPEILAGNNGHPNTCEARIAYLVNHYGLEELAACAGESESSKNTCGDGIACHPKKCPQPPPTEQEAQDIPLGAADKAVDGNTDQLYSSGSVSATNVEDNPWWQVGLESLCKIEKIVIYNRSDARSDHLKKFHVEVLNLNAGGVWEVVVDAYSEDEAGSVALVNFRKGAKGQVVRIRIDGKASLNLAEVKVYGKVIG